MNEKSRATERRLAVSLVAALFATLGLAGVGAMPANAAYTPSIFSIHVVNVHVNSASCRQVPYQVEFDDGGYDIDDIDMQVWRDNTNIDSEMMIPDQGASSVSDYWQYCPGLYGVGTFRAGPSEINYHDRDTYDSGATEDAATTQFVVKQAASARISGKRSGSYVSFIGRVWFFDIDSSSWTWGCGHKLSLQKRGAGSTTWTTVSRASLSCTTAKAHFARQRAAKAAYWRVVSGTTAKTWGSKSKQVHL